MILHVAMRAEWSAAGATGPYRPASLDEVGFVHCSPDAATTLAVANAFYRDAPGPLVVLVIDESELTAELRWEDADPAPPPGVPEGTRFPHVYGPVDRAAVVEVRYVRRDPSGRCVALARRPPTAEALDLLPHPEGGWYRETWRTEVTAVPDRRPGTRSTATGIYFLLERGDESCWHAVASDEVWFWHHGGPLTLLLDGAGAEPAGRPQALTLGADLAAGQVPQALVPAGTWQAARPAGDDDVLVSCVVSPGFDFADFRTAPAPGTAGVPGT